MPTTEAAAARTGATAVAAPASTQLVVLRLGREEYALPIAHVQEIIFWTPPRPVSSDLPWVSGVIALRGKILPVFDLALRLGVPREAGRDARIVVVETGAEQIGVTVDDATEVLTVQAGELEAMPPGTGHDLLRAITKVDERLIAVLDPSMLAAAARPEERAEAPVAAGATATPIAGPGATAPATPAAAPAVPTSAGAR